MFSVLITAVKNILLDTVFPPSARSHRIAEADAPLPYAPSTRRIGAHGVTVLASYFEPRVRDAICALKFERDRRACALLADMLNDFLVEYIADEALFGGRTVAVPIPLGKKRLAGRGLNQIESVLRATHVVRSGRLPLVPALVRTRETNMQSTLQRAERITNMRGAFSLAPNTPSLRNTTVLLIDDVTTTGATLSEAAEPLREAGATVQLIALAG
ncbi:ComF family protein [Candidatus Kaiserbacteria bacterium]|nr:ComF family protein [Candidatus Kaiserbacteria bacterium]